jgi:nucleotide-binding universal stress UspA family protein
MHKVIIPVDFSETSLNAVRYTAKMLAGRDDVEAIIYHNYETNSDLDISLIYQETLKKEFHRAGVPNVKCEHDMGGDLVDNISSLAHSTRAAMVIMGITGKSAIRQIMFGSNTLRLIDKNLYPVMIIPPDASYTGMTNVAFASDLKNVEVTTPAALISSVLAIFNPKLHIINVSKEHFTTPPPELLEERDKLRKMFSDFETEFYFITSSDFFEALDTFTREKKIDVLVTVPKHQSNSNSLFKTTHTKRLAYNSQIPILAAHQ